MAAPKLFISYCWSSPEHEEWVMQLGTELLESGVDVILDKWDLKEGNDANAFMERMVTDDGIKKVILVIDDQYGNKANARVGGVGTETQIISAEVYESVDQNKFVAVIASRDGNGKAQLPAFYKSRIYIDLSDGELYARNFEQLLRWVFDKPLNIKPELGEKPSFLDDGLTLSLGTTATYKRCVDAVRNSKPYAEGALTEYFELFAVNLEKFRLEPSAGAADFDDKVINSIEQFTPFKNELVEIFSALAQSRASLQVASQIHKFFEALIPYCQRPTGVSRSYDWDWDNLKYIVQESFLYCVAILLKYERFDVVEYIAQQRYYADVNDDYGQDVMHSFSVFRSHLKSFEHRNTRLKLNRLSLHADSIKERSANSVVTFNQLMQADFLLYVADAIHGLSDGRRNHWWPETLVFKAFHGGSFEIFLRSESTSYFEKIAPIWGVKSKDNLSDLITAWNSGKTYVPSWQSDRISPTELMNYKNLASRP